jgi:hypothetical protein
MLIKNKIIDENNILDFAGGYGTLARILRNYFGIELLVYDPFIKNSIEDNTAINYITFKELEKYQVVFNSAMFEHITSRKNLEDLNTLVDKNGCLILHTVICENIPKNPDWFYLRPPVHCAFFTNRSMEILMKEWNYTSSIYCPASKCWILFKGNVDNIKIEKINIELQEKYFFYKKGFVDYWKGF